MKKYLLTTILFVLLLFSTLTTEALVRTEGVIDLNKMASEINGNMHDFTLNKNELVKNIKSSKTAIRKMNTDYKKAESRKEKIEIQANTSAETAKFWNYTEEIHLLKIDTIETVLPKLDKLRKSAGQGILGRIEKQMNDPAFRKETKTLYSNLSTMALALDNPKLKKEISEILRNNDRLYRKNRKGLSAYNNIIKIIDKITEHFHSEYAKSRQALRIIQRKKKETEMTIESIRYSLTLQPLQTSMLDINLDEAFDVPEIELDELLFIDNEQSESGVDTTYYNDPDIDKSLERFQDGPEFLK